MAAETVVGLPAPDRYVGEDCCGDCVGTGVTGQQYYQYPASERGWVLVVDEICPTCGGCGRDGRHRGCDARQHFDWDALMQPALPPAAAGGGPSDWSVV